MSATRTQAPEAPQQPVIRVTSYDKVSAFLIALVMGLILSVVWLAVVWANNRVSVTESTADLEILEMPGGVPDGAPDETLNVESPAEISDDPSLAEVPAEESEVQEMIENVIELADEATNQAEKQYELGLQNAGKPGSAKGTGRRPLGEGGGPGSGFPREQRWFVRFSDTGSVSAYAQQLQFFGIELGALLPGGKLHYLTDLTAAKPTLRTASTGKDEKRLYMTWRGGSRRGADVELFKKAGVDVAGATLFHFYPPPVEQALAVLERDYANRPVKDIRRTYFAVRPASGRFEFYVTRQSYH